MNKNIILYGAIAISVVIAGFVLFSGKDDFETQYNTLKTSGELSKSVDKEVAIKYENTPKQQPKEQPKVKEKFVETKTLDASKKFELAIINEQTWDESKMAASIVKISGTIDNNPFFLVVPSYLLTDQSELKLRITNTQTGEAKTMFAPFIKDISINSVSNNLNINSSDMSNYTFEQKAGILPYSNQPPSLPSN